MQIITSYNRFSLSLALLLVLAVGGSRAQEKNTSETSVAASLKKLSVEELMNVEVTSVSRRPEKLAEVASAIQVITQEEIRRSGATTLAEALRLATNLQVAQVNSSQWAISARGFNNVLANKLLVMIDGRTVYTPLYAGVFWDVQNVLLDNIERIEVISGPGGTLWGANAVNGVINVITKNAKESQGALIEGGVGSEMLGYGGARYGGKISNNLYYRINAMAFKRGSVLNLEGEDAKDDWTIAQGGFRIDWQGEDDELMLVSNLYGNRPNPDATGAIEANGHNVVGRWSHDISDNSDFKVQVYYDQTYRDFRNGFTERLNTYDLDGQQRIRLNKHHEIIWGLGYRLMDHRVQNLELFRFDPGHEKLHLYNIFLQDRITMLQDRLNISLGCKLEHNSYTGFQFQPSARISMALSSNQSLWTAVSRAVRNPSRIDRDFSLLATPELALLSGSDDFKSEEVLAYELGWRMQSQTQFSLSVTTFYNVYENLRSAEPGAPPLFVPITFANGVEGNSYGVEFSGTYQPASWWRLRGGYTFVEKDLSIKPTSNDLNGGRVESNDPAHQFLVQSMMEIPGNIEVGVIGRYVDDLPEPRVASYWGLDATIAWRLYKFIEVSITAQNLLDNQHIEFIPSNPEARNIQRSVYGKVACRF